MMVIQVILKNEKKKKRMCGARLEPGTFNSLTELSNHYAIPTDERLSLSVPI